jgi:hypothetical protein
MQRRPFQLISVMAAAGALFAPARDHQDLGAQEAGVAVLGLVHEQGVGLIPIRPGQVVLGGDVEMWQWEATSGISAGPVFAVA